MFKLVPDYLDKPLLRMYRRWGGRWEDKEHSIYTLSSMIGIPSYIIGVGTLGYLTKGWIDLTLFISWSLTVGNDVFYNAEGLFGEFKEDKHTSETVVVDKHKNHYDNLNRGLRLPVFISGSGFIGKVALDALSYGTDSLDYNKFAYLILGASFIGMASSMYLNVNDPKYLKREPSKLKALIEKLSEKSKEFIPAPSPSPKPAFQLYESLLYCV